MKTLSIGMGFVILVLGGGLTPANAQNPLQYHGGPVLSSFTIYPLYYGNWEAADITAEQSYLNDLASYISGVNAPAGQQPMLKQYGVNQVSVAARGPAAGTAMFRRAIHGQGLPKYLSTDNDPLYRFHQWQANLRVLEVMEIKTVPYVPLSHPFVERLVGTIRRECLDRTLFWTTADLEAKLREFQKYFNEHRTHAGIEGRLPDSGGPGSPISLASYRWQKHCRGLHQTPIAA